MFMMYLNTFWKIKILAKSGQNDKTKYSLIVFSARNILCLQLKIVLQILIGYEQGNIGTPQTAFLHRLCVRKLNHKCQCRDINCMKMHCNKTAAAQLSNVVATCDWCFWKPQTISVEQSTLYFPLTPLQRSEISTSIFAHFAQNHATITLV